MLLELHRASMGPHIEATWGPWDDAVQAGFWEARVSEGLLQVILVSGAAAGLIEVRRTEDVTELVNVELAPAFQNQGIGTALLNDLQRESAERGVPVRLQVLRLNPARRLYERQGFTTAGETEWHVQMYWNPR